MAGLSRAWPHTRREGSCRGVPSPLVGRDREGGSRKHPACCCPSPPPLAHKGGGRTPSALPDLGLQETELRRAGERAVDHLDRVLQPVDRDERAETRAFLL